MKTIAVWFISLAVLPPACLAAASWPAVPAPPRARLETVAHDVRVNGLLSRIDRFDTDLSVDESISHYRKQWASLAASTKESTANGWRFISLLQRPFQIVVQVRARSPQGSTGLLSVVNLLETSDQVLPRNWPRWADTRVLQVTDSVDAGRRSHLIGMQSDQGFEVNLQRWRSEWLRRGFTLMHEIKPAAETGTTTWLASFDKPPQTLDIVLVYRSSDRSSHISANLVGPAEELAR